MLRQATERDAERIARLHIESWRATYADELSAELLGRQDLASREAAWRRQLQEGITVLLVEDGGDLAGFVACGPARNVASDESRAWEIYNLHVAPSRHGRGFGSALFDAAAHRGREAGETELVLWVVRTNAAARAFYERKGMGCDGGWQEHPVGPGEVLHEVRYRIRLSAREVGP